RCAAPTGAWSGALVWLAGALCYGEWPEERGREAAAAVPADGVGAGGIDAVFCGSDQIRRGVADGLRDLGVKGPDDVASSAWTTGCRWQSRAVRPSLRSTCSSTRSAGSRLRSCWEKPRSVGRQDPTNGR